MTLDFPSNPTIGLTTSISDKTWQYNGKGWKLLPNQIQGIQGLQGLQGLQGNRSQNRYTVGGNNGDAILYKGCERDHWREPLPSNLNWWKRLTKKEDSTYHHQVFFHYVLANGIRAHCANDMSK